MAIRNTLFSFRRRLKRGARVLFRTDNTVSLSILRRMGSRWRHLGEALEPVLRWTLRRKIWLMSEHVPGVENVQSDRLSRMTPSRNEWRLSDDAYETICDAFGTPTIDWFASLASHRCRRYCSRLPDPRATLIDAFRHSWTGEFGLFVPPINLIDKVVQRMALQGAEGVVVAPLWPSRPFFGALMQASRSPMIVLPVGAMIPAGVHPLRDHRCPPLVAFRL